MAASVAIKRLENVTDCTICIGDLTDAKVLPCAHSFCLKCIDKWSQNKKSGEKVACPLCRNEFVIPEGGTAALPQNSFVEKLLAIKKLSSTLAEGEKVCDVCCDEEKKSGKKVTKKATVYCADCRRNMCDLCCGHHQKFRFPGVHKLIDLKSEMSVDELLLKFPENVCHKHSDKYLEIYCFDCSLAVCMMCYIKSHNSHKCSDIKEVAEDLSRDMSVNAENLTSKVTVCETMLKYIEKGENEFCNSVAETEKLVSERADKLTQLIEGYKQSLLGKLSVSKDRQLKQTANVREEIQRHQIMLENFIRYCNEVKEKGTACDIVKLAGDLNARSKELQQFDMSVDLPIDYDVTEVAFRIPVPQMYYVNMKDLFGELTIDVQGVKMSGKVVHIIPSTRQSVTGIAILNDHLHVSHWGNQQIAIYCPKTLTYQHRRYVNTSAVGYGSQLRHLAACHSNNCFYASDQKSQWVFKVDGQNYASSYWRFGNNPQGLSVTSSHKLLVALTADNLLRKYSTTGQLICEIDLQPAGITAPVHAVQLSDELYAVTHHGPRYQFSIVNSAGKLVRSYSGNAGALNEPRDIVVDKKGRVLVADQNNNRVLVIDPKKLTAYPLPLPGCELKGPCSLHYDAANKRLYIGEWNGGRIICCEVYW